MIFNKILLVEDNKLVALGLADQLTRRGFDVAIANNVATARRLMAENPDGFLVIIFDIRLEDPDARAITGLDLAREAQELYASCLPEIVINSAFPELNYYEVAMELSVAVFIDKKPKHDEVIRHTRVFSLKNNLMRDFQDEKQFEKLYARSRTRSDLVKAYARDWLHPKMEKFLGVEFGLFLTIGSKTICCASSGLSLPETSPVYHKVAAFMFASAQKMTLEPFNAAQVPDDVKGRDPLWGQLNDTYYLPLIVAREFRLVLGFIPNGYASLAEDRFEMATLVQKYLCVPLQGYILDLLGRWSVYHERQKMQLKATADFCLYVGGEQKHIMADGIEKSVGEAASWSQLERLADDLSRSGEVLADLADKLTKDESVLSDDLKELSLADIVWEAWSVVATNFHIDKHLLSVPNEALICADEDDLEFAFTRVLQWFASRCIKRPSLNDEPSLSVSFLEKDEDIEILFEDQTKRLSKDLRRLLFVPFAEPSPPNMNDELPYGRHLPLFLSKMLVEIRNGGFLEDRTDEKEGQWGHRIVLTLPKAPCRCSG